METPRRSPMIRRTLAGLLALGSLAQHPSAGHPLLRGHRSPDPSTGWVPRLSGPSEALGANGWRSLSLGLRPREPCPLALRIAGSGAPLAGSPDPRWLLHLSLGDAGSRRPNLVRVGHGPATALRPAGLEESGALPELEEAFDLPGETSAGLEEPRTRQEAQQLILQQPVNLPQMLQQLASIPVQGGNALRQAIWRLEDPALQNEPGRHRKEVLGTIARGWPVIDAAGLNPIQTPWGLVDLGRLNDIAQYPRRTGAYELARDLEIAHLLGLLRLSRMGNGISPLSVYQAFPDRFDHPASISWPDWTALNAYAQTLYDQKTLTLAGHTFTYQPAFDGQPPVFTVDGQAADPDEAQIAFHQALEIASQGGWSVIPSGLRKDFQRPI